MDNANSSLRKALVNPYYKLEHQLHSVSLMPPGCGVAISPMLFSVNSYALSRVISIVKGLTMRIYDFRELE